MSSAYIRPLVAALLVLLLPALSSAQTPERPVAPRSPWSAGLFTRFDSSPYKGTGGDVLVIPALAYRGERFEWQGPLARYHVLTSRKVKLSALGLVDFPAYEEDDAAILQGMGDRDYTLLGGLSLEVRPIPPLGLFAAVERDLLGVHDGMKGVVFAEWGIGRPPSRVFGVVGAGVTVQDDNWTGDRLGVSMAEALPDRPAYDPGTAVLPFVQGRVIYRIAPKWTAVALFRVEQLDDTWQDSPLVGDDLRMISFISVSRSF